MEGPLLCLPQSLYGGVRAVAWGGKEERNSGERRIGQLLQRMVGYVLMRERSSENFPGIGIDGK